MNDRGEFGDFWLYFPDRRAKHFLSGKAGGTEAAETSQWQFHLILIWPQDKLGCPTMWERLHYATAIQRTIIQPLKMFSMTFMMESAHSRLLNGAGLNLRVGTTGLIRAGWAEGPGAADARGGARKQEKTGSLLGAVPRFRVPPEIYLWLPIKISTLFLLVSYNGFEELPECSLTGKEHLGPRPHLNDLTLCQQGRLDLCNVFFNTVK